MNNSHWNSIPRIRKVSSQSLRFDLLQHFVQRRSNVGSCILILISSFYSTIGQSLGVENWNLWIKTVEFCCFVAHFYMLVIWWTLMQSSLLFQWCGVIFMYSLTLKFIRLLRILHPWATQKYSFPKEYLFEMGILFLLQVIKNHTIHVNSWINSSKSIKVVEHKLTIQLNTMHKRIH